MATKEEEEGRMFPVSDKAQSVLDVLVWYMQEGGARVHMNAAVEDIAVDAKTHHACAAERCNRSCRASMRGRHRRNITPRNRLDGGRVCVVRKTRAHRHKNSYALVPVALKDAWAKKLSGVTLEDVKLTVFQNGTKQGMKKEKYCLRILASAGRRC